MLSEKAICAPPRLSAVSPTLPLKQFQCSSDGDDGPLSSFQGRSSNASSFHASLLQAIDGVMSLALFPYVVSQAADLSRSKPLVRVPLPSCLSAGSFPFTPACQGQ